MKCDLCGGELGETKMHELRLPNGRGGIPFTLKGRKCKDCFQIICGLNEVVEADKSLKFSMDTDPN